MARRRLVWGLVSLGLLALFLSIWIGEPIAMTDPVASPPAPAPTAERPDVRPAAPEKRETIRVAVLASPDEFAAFEEQNRLFRSRHPQIRAELVRLSEEEAKAAADPAHAHRLAQDGDVWLVPNETVLAMAVNGWLLPVDDVFVGAGSQPFAAVMDSVKWNGLSWGVPYDMDPHVLVWNRDVLETLAASLEGGKRILPPEGVEASPSMTWDLWRRFPALLAETEPDMAVLALDPADPSAWLAWFASASGARADLPLADSRASALTREAEDWLAAWGERLLKASGDALPAAVRAGRAAVAVVPHSVALRAREADKDGKLVLDRSGWHRPFAWPRGRSFVVRADTRYPEAARAWIAAFTERDAQWRHFERHRKLPAHRLLFESLTLGEFQAGQAPADAFPQAPPLVTGPDVPERLERLANRWQSVAGGRWTPDEWPDS